MARRIKKRQRCTYCDKVLIGLTGHQKGCQGDLLNRIAALAQPKLKMKTHKYNAYDICTACGHSRLYLAPSDNGPCKGKPKAKKKAAKKPKPRKSAVAPPVYTAPPDRFDVERF